MKVLKLNILKQRLIKPNLFSNLNIVKRNFRDWRKEDLIFTDNRYFGGKVPSPYQPQFTLTEEEKLANEKLPVHERVLDFTKYMKHKGELKYSLGVFHLDVEPFPRLKIMMICHIILGLLNEFDNNFLYKHTVKESIQFIMEVVDQNEVLVDIENALIRFISLEKLIMKLDDEVTLLRLFLKDNFYKELLKSNKEVDKDFMKEFVLGSIFADKAINDLGEKTTHRKHEKSERPASYFNDLI